MNKKESNLQLYTSRQKTHRTITMTIKKKTWTTPVRCMFYPWSHAVGDRL